MVGENKNYLNAEKNTIGGVLFLLIGVRGGVNLI